MLIYYFFQKDYPTCGTTTTCNGHGDCVKGICHCRDMWSGPECATQGSPYILLNFCYFDFFLFFFLKLTCNRLGTAPIVVVTPPENSTGTNVGINTPSAPGVFFNIAFRTIQEINSNNGITKRELK